jgi:hypothetical protein
MEVLRQRGVNMLANAYSSDRRMLVVIMLVDRPALINEC